MPGYQGEAKGTRTKYLGTPKREEKKASLVQPQLPSSSSSQPPRRGDWAVWTRTEQFQNSFTIAGTGTMTTEAPGFELAGPPGTKLRHSTGSIEVCLLLLLGPS